MGQGELRSSAVSRFSTWYAASPPPMVGPLDVCPISRVVRSVMTAEHLHSRSQSRHDLVTDPTLARVADDPSVLRSGQPLSGRARARNRLD